MDSKSISYGITIRYVINCFSAIFAGFSFKLFSRQIQYAVSLLLYGILMITLPLISNVTFYYISSALIGLVSGLIDCTTNLWVFELFSDKINFHVSIVHFSYSIGQILAPLIIRPYLANQTNLSIKQSNEIPFSICGSFFLIVSFFVFICYFIKVSMNLFK